MELDDISEEDIWQIADYSAIVARGLDYYETGQISSMEISNDRIKAKVRGSYGTYDVEITIEDEELEVDCDCPFNGYGCKHIVAVLFKWVREKGDNNKIGTGSEYDVDEVEAKPKKIYLDRELSRMSKGELISILSNLCENHKDAKRDVMFSIKGNPASINAGRDIILGQISDILFNNGDYIDYNSVFDIVRELDDLKETILTISPETRSDLLRSLIKESYDAFRVCDDSGGRMGEFLVDCLSDLGRSIHEQDLSFDERIKLIQKNLDLFDDEDHGLEDGYEKLIVEIPTTDEELEFLIGKLRSRMEEHDHKHRPGRYQDMLTEAYKRAGRDEEYLAILQKNAEIEREIMPLIRYWNEKGDLKKAIDTAEKALLNKMHPFEEINIFNFIKETYESGKDWENLLRIMVLFFERMPCLELYKQVKKDAERVNKWSSIKTELIKEISGEGLIDIHLFEGRNDDAFRIVESGEDRLNEQIRKKVASAIEKENPIGALDIYFQIIGEHIAKKNRTAYRIAALYAKRVKEIYIALGQEDEWKRYIALVREENRIRPALIQEFRRL